MDKFNYAPKQVSRRRPGPQQPDEFPLGAGPCIESVHSDVDPADIPVPDDGTDFDLDDESFWALWLAKIRNDEYIAPDHIFFFR